MSEGDVVVVVVTTYPCVHVCVCECVYVYDERSLGDQIQTYKVTRFQGVYRYRNSYEEVDDL